MGYGVIGGIGLGIGYIAPVSTLVRYFPDRRGLATGLAIMGFGFGALIYGPLMAWMLAKISAGAMFCILGGWYMLIMVSVAQYLKKPAYDPAGEAANSTNPAGIVGQLTVKEALRTPQFYGLWVMLFINVTCGIAVISAASPLLQEKVGMNAIEAAGVVGILGLFNGLGRILWASASDMLGRVQTLLSLFYATAGRVCDASNLSHAWFSGRALPNYYVLWGRICHYPCIYR